MEYDYGSAGEESVSFSAEPHIVTLNIDNAPEMAYIASQAHSHPMSLSTIESCFGHLYQSFGIYLADELQGFAIVHQVFEDATLMDICISPKSQGRGFGRLLLESVVESANEKGAETLFLEVRKSGLAAISLYKREGFKETGHRKGYYKTADGNEDAILMELAF